MDRRLLGIAALAAIVMPGCSGAPALSFPQWASSGVATPEANSGYAAYCRAADLAEKAAGKLGSEVNFTPGKRRMLVQSLGPALKELSRGFAAPTLGFELSPASLEGEPRYHQGFRLLGIALQFKVQDAIEREDFGSASLFARQATRLGFDLCHGGALDASLGMSIANDARIALGPAIPRMSQKQLQELAAGYRRLLDDRPSMLACLENERIQMLNSVQALQEAYLSGEAEKVVLRLNLPTSARKTILGMKDRSTEEKLAFFKGFAEEVETKSKHWRDLVALPTSLRDPMEGRVEKIKLASSRPWGVFSDHFCSLGEPLIVMNDDNLARTRLLVLEAALLSKTKGGANVPKAINDFNDVAIDPYTGRLFAYHADAKEFRVYSAGPNLIDDGGEMTDTGRGLDVFMD